MSQFNFIGSIRGWFTAFEDKIIPVLIYVVGMALIIDTGWELRYSVLNYDQYQFMFRWMSPQTIFLRYCISIIVRCVFIVVVTGVLLRRETFRKVLVWFMWLGLMILYWKHPYQAIVNANLYDHTNLSYFYYTVRFPWAPQYVFYPGFLLKTLEMYLLDLIRASFVIFLFIHPTVRRIFK